MILPWQEPVGVAEQFSMLDQMSGRRTILGIGLGLARVEFDGFRTAVNSNVV